MTTLTTDALAQEIRRVDGENRLGAGALAEALMPLIQSAVVVPDCLHSEEPAAWRSRSPDWGTWHDATVNADQANDWRRYGRIVEPLYATLPAPSGAVSAEILNALGMAKRQIITLGGDPRGDEHGDKIQAAVLDALDLAIAGA